MIPLIDLKEQYAALREEIGVRISEVLASGHYVLGPNVENLEKEVATFLDAKHAVGVASGTDALHLAIAAAGIGAGDEVITTPFTFAATAEAISYVQATAVFVDIDPVSFNIDPGRIESAITPRTKAILPVHLFGLSADMEAIESIARAHGLLVIEDCAQSFGARVSGTAAGTFGLAGCLSFYPSKNLSCYGDGGMILTDSDEFSKNLRVLRNHGSSRPYHHDKLGFNSRLDELQAAILRIKLENIESYNENRRRVARRYTQLLDDLPIVTPHARSGMSHVYCQYTIRTPLRDQIRVRLSETDIGTAIYYPVPLHRQQLWRQDTPSLPVCDQVSEECLSLPMFPELQDEQIEHVVDTIRSVFA